jgi:hypothetical protein
MSTWPSYDSRMGWDGHQRLPFVGGRESYRTGDRWWVGWDGMVPGRELASCRIMAFSADGGA